MALSSPVTALAGLLFGAAACHGVVLDGEIGGGVGAGASEVGCGAAALYHGDSETAGLPLSPAERLSIGLVTAGAAPPGYFCTGTVVGAEWVLTAKHCDFGGRLAFAIPDRETPEAGGPAIESLEVIRHPTLDLVLFRIPRLPGLRPIPALANDGAVALEVSRTVVLAGLGETEDGTVRERRFLATAVTQVGPDSLTFDGRGRAGACLGDSGGPVLLARPDGVRVAGVLSKGSRSCVDLDIAVRLDTVSDWLDQHVPPAPAGHPGCG